MKRIFLIPFMILMLSALIFAGCAAPAPAPAPAPTPSPTGPIELKAVSFLPPFIEDVYFLGVFAERVTERSNGELIIDWVGGPEVIPMFELAESVRTGVIDIAAPGAGLYADMVPEALSMPLSKLTPQKERETGYYDFMANANKGANLNYMGRLAMNTNFYLFTNKKVARPQELAGQKMASSFLFQDFMNGLGIVPVDIDDEYSGMQRGLLDGTGGADVQAAGSSWPEVVKYWIDHPFYVSDVVLVINPDVWNQLPKHLQDLMREVQTEIEQEQGGWFGERGVEALQAYVDGGMEPIKFSPDDAEWYVNLAYESKWGKLKEKVGSETYTKLRELLLQ